MSDAKRYKRMADQFPRAIQDYHKRDFERERTQDPRGCDSGARVEPVFYDDDTTDEEAEEWGK